MPTLAAIISATILVGLLSFLGLFVFGKKTNIQKIMEAAISLAAAVLLANVFLDLLPELMNIALQAKGQNGFHLAFKWILLFIVFFILVEKYLHWYHFHQHQDEPQKKEYIHPLGYNVLIGDGLHNFIDGATIAASFMLNFNTGVITTLAIILHEIPHEVGNFSLLLHAGFSRMKALTFNVATGILAVLGGIVTFFYIQTTTHLFILLTATVASFLYISLSDIIPELHQKNSKHFAQQLIWFFIGLIFVFIANHYFHE